jgi:hypothetical protein
MTGKERKHFAVKGQITPELEYLLQLELEFERLTYPTKMMIDGVIPEQLERMIKSFKKLNSRQDEILFLKNLLALKKAKKNLEKVRIN